MVNRRIIFFTSFISLFRSGSSELEGFVVGGEYAKISNFPHSAFLAITCYKTSSIDNWACGSSIINQVILLSAAHCLEDCQKSTEIGVSVGSEHRTKGLTNTASTFVLHPYYDDQIVKNDLAMIRLRSPLGLGAKVKRVALMRKPPYNEIASVAGWGLIDEDKMTGTMHLKEAKQFIWPRQRCVELFDRMHEGTFCAGLAKNEIVGYAAEGDSGSALVVRGYIQIGLVSYKLPNIAVQVAIYTDVAYFYDWIQSTAKSLYCYS